MFKKGVKNDQFFKHTGAIVSKRWLEDDKISIYTFVQKVYLKRKYELK